MIFVIAILLFLLAVCSVVEVSFSSLNIIRIKKLKDNGNKRAKVVYDLYQKYSEVVTIILVINCIISVSVSSLTTLYFSNLIGDKYIWIVTLILTLFILIFTEIIPKILAREYSEDFAMEYCYILKYLFVIFIPLNKIISKFENKVKNDHKVTATKDELVEIVKTIEGEGVVDEKDSVLIQKAALLKKLKVSNVMDDKNDESYFYDTDSSYKVKKCIFRDNHDRIPIINKDGKAVGILYEVDLLDEILDNGTISIKRSMMEPICISKSTNLASCLELLNNARAHMALVTDRSNNFLGIVTVEDIISELMKSQTSFLFFDIIFMCWVMIVIVDLFTLYFSGFTKINNKITFVSDVLPNEIVDVKIINEKKNFNEAKVISYIEKSSDRIENKCPYSDKCGGCDFGYLNYKTSLMYKKNMVVDVMKRYAGLDINPSIISSDNIFGYRNKISLRINDGKLSLIEKNSNDYNYISR